MMKGFAAGVALFAVLLGFGFLTKAVIDSRRGLEASHEEIAKLHHHMQEMSEQSRDYPRGRIVIGPPPPMHRLPPHVICIFGVCAEAR